MGLDFLANNGACRMRNYDAQPTLLDDGTPMTEDPDRIASLDYETPLDEWSPVPSVGHQSRGEWPLCPMRFIDGKDVGRTVAWLQTREGYPVPVRLSEIGAVVMRDVDGCLKREYDVVERVVSFIADPFPWDQVESFAIALQKQGFRLLTCQPPSDGLTFDFELMRRATQNRSNSEMVQLERQALSRSAGVPTIVDGALEPRTSILKDHTAPVVGIIKTHRQNYLHPQGWRVFYSLQAGQRTPAFRVEGRDFSVISWYLRLDGKQGEMPNWGTVRLEIPEQMFRDTIGRDWTYIDRLSRVVCDYRCRDSSYGRAPVSIHPIQRAEESLSSLFTQSDTLVNRFYHLTSL